jgi:hypothetical protein
VIDPFAEKRAENGTMISRAEHFWLEGIGWLKGIGRYEMPLFDMGKGPRLDNRAFRVRIPVARSISPVFAGFDGYGSSRQKTDLDIPPFLTANRPVVTEALDCRDFPRGV